MSRKRERVDYHLDSGNVSALNEEEIKAILRAADPLIATAGRGMLAKKLIDQSENLLEKRIFQIPSFSANTTASSQAIFLKALINESFKWL